MPFEPALPGGLKKGMLMSFTTCTPIPIPDDDIVRVLIAKIQLDSFLYLLKK